MVSRSTELKEDAACGDGPVDAVYKAIEKVTIPCGSLPSMPLPAARMPWVVTVKVEYEGDLFIGRGISTDILASARAYISAINKLVHDVGFFALKESNNGD